VLAALVPALFAYGGWQHALWISGEVRDPKRTLPRAIVGGVVIVIVVYVLANWAYLRLLGPGGVAGSKTLAADAVAAAWPETGARIVACAVALSAFGVLNAQLLSGPRLIFGMARDGRFFRPFGELSPRFGTPVAAILLLSLGALALLYIVRDKDVVDRLTTGVVFVDTVFFALTGVGLFLLRRRERAGARDGGTFRVPGYPVVPALFIVGELGLLVGALWNEAARVPALIGAGWIVAGAVLYLVRFRRK
jgi:APA family basic amino acid/polyamine antiporter